MLNNPHLPPTPQLHSASLPARPDDNSNTDLGLSCNAMPHNERSLLGSVRLPREVPFGVTTIIGGTNVRFCVSLPGCSEPIVHSVTWDEVQESSSLSLSIRGRTTEEERVAVFTRLARHFLDFIGTITPDDGGPPPFESLRAFNVSVAGIVDGEGINANVTTSNTGVPIRGEPIARYLADALRNELSLRGWGEIPWSSTLVMNDAVAGMLGEHALGDLEGYHTGLYFIIGTGVGSMGLSGGEPCFRYSQMGQNIIYNSLLKTFSVGEGTDVLTTIDSEGNFKELPAGHHYLENYLGGPWLATRFVKKLCGDYALHPLVKELANQINPYLVESERDDILPKLIALGDLPSQTRHTWASFAPSGIVKAINTFLLDPALPLSPTSDLTSRQSPSHRLNILASAYKRHYFADIGRAVGALITKMERDHFHPQKVVIGGGIGEVCGRYDVEPRDELLRTINRHSKTPDGLIGFSTMSAEARECAVTLRSINEIAKRERGA